MSQPFRVGITRDFLKPEFAASDSKKPPFQFDAYGLESLERSPSTQWEFLARDSSVLSSELVSDYDALVVLNPRVTAETLEETHRLKLIARYGVGYDNIDVDACTRNGVLLTITPDGVRRPVAAAAITLLLALSHKLLIKDRLLRAGRWSEKLHYMGQGLTERTLGVIGLGNIGREVLQLAKPFGMRLIGSDPHVRREELTSLGVELVDLDSLLSTSDYVVICCSLVPETHHLIDAGRLAQMKPTAYLINVARGPIVDEEALIRVLRAGSIQGAGLDVFEQEPIAPENPLLELENVILTPHALCWTDECFQGNGRSVSRSILAAAAGKIPEHAVNRGVLKQNNLRLWLDHDVKLDRVQSRTQGEK